MPRGTLVTTLYPAEIPWLEISRHHLEDRSLLAALKGSWLGDTRVEQSILYPNPALLVKSNSQTQRGQSRALCGVTQGFGDTAKPLRAVPTPPLHCKNHHCALSKATFTGLVYFIYRDRGVWAPGGEKPMQFWGKLYIFMNFWSTESCSRRHAGGGRVLL